MEIKLDLNDEQRAGLKAAVAARNNEERQRATEEAPAVVFTEETYLQAVMLSACDSYYNNLVKP